MKATCFFFFSAEVSSLSGGNEPSPRVTRLSSQLAMSTVLAKSSVGTALQLAGICWNILEEGGSPCAFCFSDNFPSSIDLIMICHDK